MNLIEWIQAYRLEKKRERQAEAHKKNLDELKAQLPVYPFRQTGKVKTDPFWKDGFPYEEVFENAYIINRYDEKLLIRLDSVQKEAVRREMEISWENTWKNGKSPQKAFTNGIDEMWILNEKDDLARFIKPDQLSSYCDGIDFCMLLQKSFLETMAAKQERVMQYTFASALSPDILNESSTLIEKYCCMHEGKRRFLNILLVNNTDSLSPLFRLKQYQIMEKGTVRSHRRRRNAEYGMIRVTKPHVQLIQKFKGIPVCSVVFPYSQKNRHLIVNPEDTRESGKYVYIRIDKKRTSLVEYRNEASGKDEMQYVKFDELVSVQKRKDGTAYQNFMDETARYADIFGESPVNKELTGQKETEKDLNLSKAGNGLHGQYLISENRILHWDTGRIDPCIKISCQDDPEMMMEIPQRFLHGTSEEGCIFSMAAGFENGDGWTEELRTTIPSDGPTGYDWLNYIDCSDIHKKLSSEPLPVLACFHKGELMSSTDSKVGKLRYVKIYFEGSYYLMELDPKDLEALDEDHVGLRIGAYEKVQITDRKMKPVAHMYAWQGAEAYEEAQKEYFDPEIRYRTEPANRFEKENEQTR